MHVKAVISELKWRGIPDYTGQLNIYDLFLGKGAKGGGRRSKRLKEGKAPVSQIKNITFIYGIFDCMSIVTSVVYYTVMDWSQGQFDVIWIDGKCDID